MRELPRIQRGLGEDDACPVHPHVCSDCVPNDFGRRGQMRRPNDCGTADATLTRLNSRCRDGADAGRGEGPAVSAFGDAFRQPSPER